MGKFQVVTGSRLCVIGLRDFPFQQHCEAAAEKLRCLSDGSRGASSRGTNRAFLNEVRHCHQHSHGKASAGFVKHRKSFRIIKRKLEKWEARGCRL